MSKCLQLTLDSNTVTSIPKLCSCLAAARPDTPPPITITLPVFLAVKRGYCPLLLVKTLQLVFFVIYNEETELTGQRLDPFVNTKVNQAVSFQVAVYPVDQHCITWKEAETMSSVTSLKLCFLDQERLKELNILLLYGASSCCSAVSMVSWILGLSSHSWSCIRVVKTKWL